MGLAFSFTSSGVPKSVAMRVFAFSVLLPMVLLSISHPRRKGYFNIDFSPVSILVTQEYQASPCVTDTPALPLPAQEKPQRPQRIRKVRKEGILKNFVSFAKILASGKISHLGSDPAPICSVVRPAGHYENSVPGTPVVKFFGLCGKIPNLAVRPFNFPVFSI
jgi:hypothetical protein